MSRWMCSKNLTRPICIRYSARWICKHICQFSIKMHAYWPKALVYRWGIRSVCIDWMLLHWLNALALIECSCKKIFISNNTSLFFSTNHNLDECVSFDNFKKKEKVGENGINTIIHKILKTIKLWRIFVSDFFKQWLIKHFYSIDFFTLSIGQSFG